MSKNNWSKEDKSADSSVQPWNLTVFDQIRPQIAARASSAQVAEQKRSTSLNPSQPPAVDVQSIVAEAQQRGYAEGFEQGLIAGREAGEAQGAAETTEVSQRLSLLMDNLQQGLQEVEDRWAEEIIALALEVAKQMVRQALNFRPEIITHLVREATQFLPGREDEAMLKIYLHPLDSTLLQEQHSALVSSNRWRLLEDATIERGGCRVVSEYSDLDATLPERWRRLAQSLAKDDLWIEEPWTNETPA